MGGGIIFSHIPLNPFPYVIMWVICETRGGKRVGALKSRIARDMTWTIYDHVWKESEKITRKKKSQVEINPPFKKNEWNTVYKTWKLTLIPYHYYVIIHVIFSVRFDFALVFHNRLINTAFSLLNPNVAAPPCSQPCVFSTCSTFG